MTGDRAGVGRPRRSRRLRRRPPLRARGRHWGQRRSGSQARCPLPTSRSHHVGDSFLDQGVLPLELLTEHLAKFHQQCARRHKLDSALDAQAVDGLRRPTREHERGDQDVGVEDGPQPRRSSWISRSTSRSFLIPKRPACAAPCRWRDSNRCVSRQIRYTRNISRNSSLLLRPSSWRTARMPPRRRAAARQRAPWRTASCITGYDTLRIDSRGGGDPRGPPVC